MRKLIITNTYYQLLFAIQLRATVFLKDEVVLLITDHSNHADVISKHVNETYYFEEVHYVRTKDLGDTRAILKRIEDFVQISFGKYNRYGFFLKELKNFMFDEVLVFNYNVEIYGIYSILSQQNARLKVSRFEEGCLGYNTVVMDNLKRKIMNALRNLQQKPVINSALHNFYCFYPELYLGELKPVYVPTIDTKSKILNIIRGSFGVEDDALQYNEKYIFFTSVYDFEGGEPIGEYEVVCKVAELIGKENLLIKLHPRDKRTVYEDNGFKVDKNSSIPWEAIQLSGDFTNKVFLTVTSGSVLAGSLMSEEKVNTYYMYNCCDFSNNQLAIKTTGEIQKLLKNSKMREILKKVKVVERIEDILS